MIDKKSIVESIINEIKQLAVPWDGFKNYMHSKMYNYYSNFLEYIFTFLLDDYCLEEHIKDGTFIEWGMQEDTVETLVKFSKHLKIFYARHQESDDYTLLRDNYWDAFSKEAKECVKLLEQDLENVEGFDNPGS